MKQDYNKAKQKLLTPDFKSVQQFFVENNYILELAYSKIFEEELEDAKSLLNSINDIDTRAKWTLTMISLIEGKAVNYPTYFQLRNFFEIDLNLLITHYKGEYVENILRYSDSLFNVNTEIYKYIGRVLYINGLKEQGIFFLERAKNYFYNDPELHFCFATINYENKNFDEAMKNIETCLAILPEYFPAINLYKIITDENSH
ncbi:MAG: hypothetical protein R3Y28_00580 [Candidatus Gastranaerophilales bacterium]